jgi:hypothetical protein
MCRYAFKHYKQSYSCFECRKTFKKTTFKDYLKQLGKLDVVDKLSRCINQQQHDELMSRLKVDLGTLEAEYHQLISVCPQCGGQLANMGMDFKSPKTDDLKAWNIIQGMYDLGEIYQTCGCQGFGLVPKNKSDYVRYLKSSLASWQSALESTLKDEKLNAFQRHERGAYWQERIDRIEHAIQSSA